WNNRSSEVWRCSGPEAPGHPSITRASCYKTDKRKQLDWVPAQFRLHAIDEGPRAEILGARKNLPDHLRSRPQSVGLSLLVCSASVHPCQRRYREHFGGQDRGIPSLPWLECLPRRFHPKIRSSLAWGQRRTSFRHIRSSEGACYSISRTAHGARGS